MTETGHKLCRLLCLEWIEHHGQMHIPLTLKLETLANTDGINASVKDQHCRSIAR